MILRRQINNSLLPLLLLFIAQKVCAQLLPADDFFNGGAQLYISNNIPAALEKTENGLKLYPNDEKLKKLEELLKQQQQSQSSQSQQNQQNQQSQKNQTQQQAQNNQQPQNQQDQNQSGQKKEDDQKPQQQKPSDEKKNGENQPVAGQMTPEEAKQLLDAQKGNEQVLQLKPQGKPENQNRSFKDW
jgi:Ca-activated chloride channel family protein